MWRRNRQIGKIHEKLKIESLGYGWLGISSLENGKKVLIKWALPDSIVDVRIVKKKRDYLTGHIVKVHDVDKKWLDGDLKCPHHLSAYKPSPKTSLSKWEEITVTKESNTWCGWCKRQIVSYEKQLWLKEDIIKNCYAQIPHIEFLPIIGSPLQFGYRNKIEFSFGKYLKREAPDEDGTKSKNFAIAEHWQMWFHKQWEFSKVVNVDQCYLVSEHMHSMFDRIKKDLKKSWLPVHDAKTHHGLLRHLMIREWVHTNHLLVNLSIASKHFDDHPKDQKIRKEVLKSWKSDKTLQDVITTFVLSENNGLADIFSWADTTHEIMRGEWKIYEELHFNAPEDLATWSEIQNKTILRFAISPASFFQTNTHAAEVLFSTANTMLGDIKGNIIDLYCGWGSIWLSLLALGKWNRVKGIEIVPAAIQDATYNAKINHLSDRSDYYVGKAEKLVKEWVVWGEFFVWGDVVVVDPPREWMHPDVIEFLIQTKKQHNFRLCYISCNPMTMARDVTLLLDSWVFKLDTIQWVDMFPHTHHIECIGVME